MKIRKTVGIDLGTTNSVIALLDPTDSALLTGRDEQGRATIPSVLAHSAAQGRLVTGHTARALRRSRQPLAASAKRHMGLDRRFELGEQSLSAAEVSAQVLRHCRDVLAATLNDSRYLLDAAVITMPAYFNHNQIEDTRRAAELAGFEVVELLHEPTAAAIYYSWVEGHGDASYLVYDLGGGTFDVSVIRKRFGDYEVLGVSGDPFLGGDDFDRLLATHLQEQIARHHSRRVDFSLQTEDGRFHFNALVDVAERLKIELSGSTSVAIHEVNVATDKEGQPVGLSATVERATFQALIRDKVHRTIDCCRDALGRARQKCGLTLSDIDHVILVGGSSRIPLVRDTIRAAFCNKALPEHVRHPDPLLHEPDLCVAYGAALQAATHGTRYVFPVARADGAPAGLLPDLDVEPGSTAQGLDVELHWTSPVNVRAMAYTLTGCVRGPGAAEVRHGGSLRVRCFATGLTEETFLGRDGAFALDLLLQPETDNALELTVCDNLGQELARIPACIRHRAAGGGTPGLGVLPTQLITKPLSIEVLNRGRQRVKQVVAPVGAALPGRFLCTCRTVDQAGRIVVPIFEENRVIKQMVLEGLDVRLPVGSPVEVEFRIDVRHTVEVQVQVRDANRSERVTLEGPPPPHVPAPHEVEEVKRRIEEVLRELSGGLRARIKARMEQVIGELYEARFYEDAPKAIQRMAELRELLDEAESERGRQMEPPWDQFAGLAQHCRGLAAEAARVSGRDRDEMVDYVRAQERHAERAFHERNQPLYRECWLNLQRYLYTLQDLCRTSTPPDEEQVPDNPEEAAKNEVERFRQYLARVWKEARARERKDLEERLADVARQGKGLSQQAKDDPLAAVRAARRLMKELGKLDWLVRENRGLDGENTRGLLEGTL